MPDRDNAAFIDFDSKDGSHQRGGLSEISTLGVCFSIDQDPGLSAGTIIETAIIAARERSISGRLRIVYAEASFASGTTCGAEFFPTTDGDKRALSEYIAQLELRGLRSG